MTYNLDAEYWNDRYDRGKTGWDLGHLSGAMRHIIDGLENPNAKILVPGAGNAFEVDYLWQKGFTNVYLLDWAELPLIAFSVRNPDFPRSQLLKKDFFELDDAFDLMLEQTFFCSLLPKNRPDYVKKTASLLKKGGLLKGVLFNASMHRDRPPFGGSTDEYYELFSDSFNILKMEPCEHSEPDRLGLEVEIEMEKK